MTDSLKHDNHPHCKETLVLREDNITVLLQLLDKSFSFTNNPKNLDKSHKKTFKTTLQCFFDYKTEFLLLSKQSQKSRSILKDGSRSLGLLWKGKTIPKI